MEGACSAPWGISAAPLRVQSKRAFTNTAAFGTQLDSQATSLLLVPSGRIKVVSERFTNTLVEHSCEPTRFWLRRSGNVRLGAEPGWVGGDTRPFSMHLVRTVKKAL